MGNGVLAIANGALGVQIADMNIRILVIEV